MLNMLNMKFKAALPESLSLDQIEVQVRLKGGLRESFGKAQWIYGQGESWLLVQENTTGPVEAHRIDSKPVPRVQWDGWTYRVQFWIQAQAHVMDISKTELKKWMPLLIEWGEEGGDWKDLIVLYDLAATFVVGAEKRSAFWIKKAHLLDQHGESQEAFNAYLEVLKLRREQSESRDVQRLVDLYVELGDESMLDPLIRLFKRYEQWDAWVQLMNLKAHTLTQKRALKAYVDMARVYEQQLNQPAMALKILSESLLIDPEDVGVHMQLNEWAEAWHQWEDYVEILIDLSQREVEEWQKENFLWKAAEIAEAHIPDKVIEIYQALLKIQPDHLIALQKLKDYYEGQSLWDHYLQVIDHLASLPIPDEDRMQYWKEASQKCEQACFDLEKSLDYDRKLLVQYPSELDVYAHAEKLSLKLEDWKSFLAIAEGHWRVLPRESPKIKSLFKSMMLVAFEELKDWERTLRYGEAFLERTEERERDLRVLTVLLDAYEYLHQWLKMIPILKDLAESQRDAAKYYQRWAEVLENYYDELLEQENRDFSDEELREVLELWQKVLDLEPDHVLAMKKLKLYLPALEEWERWEAHLHYMLDKKEHLNLSVEDQVEIWESLDLIESSKDNPDNAYLLEIWQNIGILKPQHPKLLDQFIELYKKNEMWDELEDFLEERFEQISDQKQRAQWLYQWGKILWTEKGAWTKAYQRFKEGLNLNPYDQKLVKAMEKLLIEGGSAQDWMDFYITCISSLKEDPKKIEWLIKAMKKSITLGSGYELLWDLFLWALEKIWKDKDVRHWIHQYLTLVIDHETIKPMIERYKEIWESLPEAQRELLLSHIRLVFTIIMTNLEEKKNAAEIIFEIAKFYDWVNAEDDLFDALSNIDFRDIPYRIEDELVSLYVKNNLSGYLIEQLEELASSMQEGWEQKKLKYLLLKLYREQNLEEKYKILSKELLSPDHSVFVRPGEDPSGWWIPLIGILIGPLFSGIFAIIFWGIWFLWILLKPFRFWYHVLLLLIASVLIFNSAPIFMTIFLVIWFSYKLLTKLKIIPTFNEWLEMDDD